MKYIGSQLFSFRQERSRHRLRHHRGRGLPQAHRLQTNPTQVAGRAAVQLVDSLSGLGPSDTSLHQCN